MDSIGKFLISHKEWLIGVAVVFFVYLVIRTVIISVHYKKRKRDIELEIERAATHAERNYWRKCKKNLWKMFF